MTLVLLDGCDDYTSWAGVPGGMTTGRGGVANTAWNFDSASHSVQFVVPAAQESATATIGFGYRPSSMSTGNVTIVSLRSDGGATAHVVLGHDGNGSLTISRGGTLIATAPSFIFRSSTWYYVELQAVLHDTTGSYTVRVDGFQVLNGVADTRNAGTKSVFDSVRFSGSITTGYFDDLYLKTGTDTFMGDVRVETLYPNGNGTVNQWVGSDGDSVDNYLLVDEPGAPVTTDYVTSSTPGQQDLYTVANLSDATAVIKGICHVANVAGSDSTPRSVRLLNTRGVTTKSAALSFSTTSFTNLHYVLENDPETGAPWTVANINALQSGIEVV